MSKLELAQQQVVAARATSAIAEKLYGIGGAATGSTAEWKMIFEQIRIVYNAIVTDGWYQDAFAAHLKANEGNRLNRGSSGSFMTSLLDVEDIGDYLGLEGSDFAEWTMFAEQFGFRV